MIVTVALAFGSMTSSAAASGSWYAANENGKQNTAMVIGVSIGIGALVALLVHNISTNNQAAAFYRQGDEYAAQGVWDLAADAYMACLNKKPGYRDAQAKLAKAKQEAEKMLLAAGDEAKAQERYAEAAELYRRALVYMPESTTAKAKLDALEQNTVAVHYRQGITYETQNRWPEALAEYEQAYRQDPRYQDIADRYQRARAHVQGNLPIKAALYFVDKAGQTGLSAPLLHALQYEMQAAAAKNYVVLDYEKVQDVVREQAPALSAAYDDRLALDLGRVLGADEVIVGEITSLGTSGDRVEITVSAKAMHVQNGSVRRQTTVTHRFSRGVAVGDVPNYLREVASKIWNDLR